MISRHWIGIVRSEMTSAYIDHLENTVMPKLNQSEGIQNAHYLKRTVNDGTEFLIVTEWDCLESIKKFAGNDYDRAVVDPYAKSMMVRYDRKVRHYFI